MVRYPRSVKESSLIRLSWSTFLLIFLFSSPAVTSAQEAPPGAPPDTCGLWADYTFPDGELSPVVIEGAFTLDAQRVESCGGESVEGAFTVTVEDDDGPIPGRVTQYTSRTVKVVAWAPEEGAVRRPTKAKNARATARFYTEYSFSGDEPGEAYEEGTFSLDVSTDPTPDPVAPSVTLLPPQLIRGGTREDTGEECKKGRLSAEWSRGAQPPGAGHLTLVQILHATGDGVEYGTPSGYRGTLSRDFLEYHERYCMTLGAKRPLVDDRTAAAEEVCVDHAAFVALLEEGERLCYGPNVVGGPSGMGGGTGGANIESGSGSDDDDDSGCRASGGTTSVFGWLLFVLAGCFPSRQRRRLTGDGSRS